MLSKKFFIFKIITLLLSAITLIFYILSFTTSYDFNIGYFNISPIVIIARISLALTLAVSIMCLFLMPKNMSCVTNINENKFFFPAALCTVMFFSFSLYKIYTNITSGSWTVLSIFSIIFGILSSIYYLLIFAGIKISETNYSLLGFCQTVWFITVVASTYFNYRIPQNSPQKIIIMFSAIAAMLYNMSEIKIVLGKQRLPIHFSLSAPVITLCSVCAALNITLITHYAADTFADCTFLAVIFISIFLYVLVRYILASPSNSSNIENNESE